MTIAKRTYDITQFLRSRRESVARLGGSPNPYAEIDNAIQTITSTLKHHSKDYASKLAFEHITSVRRESGAKAPSCIYLSCSCSFYGESDADVKEVARKGSLEERPQAGIDRLIDNMSQAGGFGIFHDLIYNIASPSDKPQYLCRCPTMSDIIGCPRYPQQIYKGYQGGKKTESEIWTPLGLEGLRRVPLVGAIAVDKFKKSKQKKHLRPYWLTRRCCNRFSGQYPSLTSDGITVLSLNESNLTLKKKGRTWQPIS